MTVWIAIAALLLAGLVLLAWMGFSLIALAHRIGTPRKRSEKGGIRQHSR